MEMLLNVDKMNISIRMHEIFNNKLAYYNVY